MIQKFRDELEVMLFREIQISYSSQLSFQSGIQGASEQCTDNDNVTMQCTMYNEVTLLFNF